MALATTVAGGFIVSALLNTRTDALVNLAAMEHLEASDFDGTVAAIAKFYDDATELRKRVHSVFGLYDGAGTALADGAAEQVLLRRHHGRN